MTDDAVDCSRGATTDVIYANLRARFGLTVKQARERLSSIEKTPNQTLQALSVEAERLVAVAFPQLAAQDRATLAIDAFIRALDNKGLKRHLLVAGQSHWLTLSQAQRSSSKSVGVLENSANQQISCIWPLLI